MFQVAHLMRAVHKAVGSVNNSSARQVAELLSSLPLPEDYALQELRSLTRSYMMEIAWSPDQELDEELQGDRLGYQVNSESKPVQCEASILNTKWSFRSKNLRYSDN